MAIALEPPMTEQLPNATVPEPPGPVATPAAAPPPGAYVAHAVFHRVLVPAAGAAAIGLFSRTPYEGVVVAFLAFASAGLLVPPNPVWSEFLRFIRFPLLAIRPLVAVGALAFIQASAGVPDMSELDAVLALLVTTALSAVPLERLTGAARRTTCTAVIGSPRSATEIEREVRLAGVGGYAIVGRITLDDDDDDPRFTEVSTIGHLRDLGRLVEKHNIDLIVMTAEVPRARVFEEVAASCLHLPVRLWEFTGFSEDVFGHVPVAEINAAWFQYIMHPRYRPTAPGPKRVVDVLAAVGLGIAFLPLLGLLALMIRRDGGPVFFKQVRVGESGRPLTVYKLRTMRAAGGDEQAQWASADDPRITGVGRILRLSHLDEFPQLLNVLRGEMSIVGPRPEQPAFVERLEERLPFYTRRHLIKPGLTGWAQVRCGYVGSDVGSAWKLCHDLYYLKHRSLAFDLAIMFETVRTLFGDRYHAVDTKTAAFIHGGREMLPVADETAAPAQS